MSVFYPNVETLHLLRPNFYCPCPKGCKNSKLVKDFRISAPFSPDRFCVNNQVIFQFI